MMIALIPPNKIKLKEKNKMKWNKIKINFN